MIKLITPISHLFEKKEYRDKIVEVSDALEARERTASSRHPKTTHYHIDFDINLGLSDNNLSFLKEQVAPREDIKTVTFQITRDYEDSLIRNGQFQPIGAGLTFKEMLDRSKISIRKIRDILGVNRNIAVENNNYYRSGAYEIATSIDFISAVINDCKIDLLYDIAHAKVTSINRGICFDEYEAKLLSAGRCIQMHLCKHKEISGNCEKIEAIDAHEAPKEGDLREAINKCRQYGIDALTLEYYRDPDVLCEVLRLARGIIDGK